MTEGETTKKHRAQAPKTLRAAVITVSSSKFDYLWSKNKSLEETEDASGKYLIEELKSQGHQVVFYTIIPDHFGLIQEMVDHVISTYSPDVIITTGGTGISGADVTIEALEEIFEKTLDGFGEFFRKASFDEIGSAGMLSRAQAGVVAETLVFSLPGSPNACRTGMNLLRKELTHLVKHLRE